MFEACELGAGAGKLPQPVPLQAPLHTVPNKRRSDADPRRGKEDSAWQFRALVFLAFLAAVPIFALMRYQKLAIVQIIGSGASSAMDLVGDAVTAELEFLPGGELELAQPTGRLLAEELQLHERAAAAAATAPAVASSAPSCPHQRLGLKWLADAAEGNAAVDGPCGRNDQEAYRDRTDFHWMGIGIQEAGMLELFRRLNAHPAAAMTTKAMGFWAMDDLDNTDPAWAKVDYVDWKWKGKAAVGEGKRRGEITPTYQTQPQVAHRLRKSLGSPLRFVTLLSDPVERAWRHYQTLQRVDGRWSTATFESLITEEFMIVADCRKRHNWDPEWFSKCYSSKVPFIGPLGQGFYAEHLALWWRHFPPCSTLVLEEKDLSVPGVDSCVFAFLDMLPYDHQVDKASNVTADWFKESASLGAVGGGGAGASNASEGMAAETRLKLQKLFKPHNNRLERLLGRTFDWGY